MILERIDYNDENVSTLCRLAHKKRYEFAKDYIGGIGKVLDAGCGEGFGSAILARIAGKVIGIDSSTEAIETATRKNKKVNLFYDTTDLEKLDIKQYGKFDLITFFEVFEHVQNPGKIVGKFREGLNEKGILLVSTPNGRYTASKNPYHIREYTRKEAEKIIINSGFNIEEVYGQYPLLAPLLVLRNRLKGIGREDIREEARTSKSKIARNDWFADLFSELYSNPIAVATSRDLVFVCSPKR